MQNTTTTTFITTDETGRHTDTSVSNSSSSTITTAAGRIEADYRTGQLKVAVDSKPGWTVKVHRRGPTHVDVVWTAGGSTVEATVIAGDSGISTTTRAVHTST